MPGRSSMEGKTASHTPRHDDQRRTGATLLQADIACGTNWPDGNKQRGVEVGDYVQSLPATEFKSRQRV